MESGRVANMASAVGWAAALGLLLLIPLSTVRLDPNHLSTFEFCTIDASATKVNVGPDGFTGLPDPFDFSRHKQVFVVYLLSYCSGYYKPGTEDVVIDFCSKPRNEIWDLFQVWSLWGVKLRADGNVKFDWLDHGPDWLWIAYIVSISTSGLSLLLSLSRAHRLVRTGRWIVAGVFIAAACAQLGTAIAAQVTYGLLVSKADDDAVSVTPRLGMNVFAVTWVAAICALIAAGLQLWYFKHTASGHTGTVTKEVNSFGFSGGYSEIKDPDVAMRESISPGNTHTSSGRESLVKYEPYRGAGI
ncbi:SUR7/PalI family-domain-containing protein [Madurella fahalii]|uniref:SUR7/PalI family-domain-containing protein n=1 Tax=Madurella fahalii TaxID=1157608 RepID=A0ABQ0GT86_9PEZI